MNSIPCLRARALTTFLCCFTIGVQYVKSSEPPQPKQTEQIVEPRAGKVILEPQTPEHPEEEDVHEIRARSVVNCPFQCQCDTYTVFCYNTGLTRLPLLGFIAPSSAELVTRLELGENAIPVVRARSFPGMARLATLNLDGNRLDTVDGAAFEGLVSLKALDLTGNRLRGSHLQAVRDLPALEELSLGLNFISEIPETAMRNIPKLRRLWLHDNSVTRLPEWLLGRATRLDMLDLRGNPGLDCAAANSTAQAALPGLDFRCGVNVAASPAERPPGAHVKEEL